MENLTVLAPHYYEWHGEDGDVHLRLVESSDEDTDQRRKLVVPLSPSSVGAYQLGDRLGYHVVSPNAEDMPPATLRTSLLMMCDDMGFACVSEVLIRYSDLTTGLVTAEENWDAGFSPASLFRQGPGGQNEIKDLNARVFLSDPESMQIDRHFYEPVGMMVYESGVDFDVAMASEYPDTRPDPVSVMNLVATIRQEVGMPFETAQEVEDMAKSAENVYFADKMEKALVNALGHPEDRALTIRAAMNMFRIDDESIKRFAANL